MQNRPQAYPEGPIMGNADIPILQPLLQASLIKAFLTQPTSAEGFFGRRS